MSFSNQPYRIAKTPFIVGDLLLLAMAGWIIWDVGGLPDGFQLGIVVGCLVVGMFFSTLPFLLDYRAELKRNEINEFQNIAEQLKALTQLEEHIRHATGQWQSIQDHCVSAVQNADKIAESMAQESTRFVEVMQSMDVSEKEHLRVEAEKLRRSEREWLQAAVRVMDHVFALHKAALQSGQPKLISQISNFQHAVVDVMRRMGLTPHEAELGTSYNKELHQVMGEDHKELTQPSVAETLAPGFTFQGRLVRPPLVRLVEQEDMPAIANGPADQTIEEPTPAISKKRASKEESEGEPGLFDQEPS
jgi:molecular chaperone GrpE (heat shock protein)